MTRATLFFAALVLAACGPDETVSGFAGEEDYTLVSLNSTDITAPVTLNISTPGTISGRAPCNTYSASQTAPYPWFDLGPIAATRAACPDLDLETTYLSTLARMTIAEVNGPVLILTNDAKEELVFQSR